METTRSDLHVLFLRVQLNQAQPLSRPWEADTAKGRRKALESRVHLASASQTRTVLVKAESEIPCWVEDRQMVSAFPASVVNKLNKMRAPLIPYQPDGSNLAMSIESPKVKIILPLSSDHLIPLLQYNVLRACLANRKLISCILPDPLNECSSAALHVLPAPSIPQDIPPFLHPTHLQRTVPHEDWIDIVPCPVWRDNIILSSGTFDEDELWSDTIGGLFEGFPNSEIEQRGVVAWSPPWHVSGWEISEGFWRKWGWSLKGCGEALEATNRWRRERREEPLVFEV